MLSGDPLANVLFIDLGRKTFRVERREKLFAERIGGAGVAIALLEELCPKGADPLGPDNPVILAVGALTGLYPLASKTVAMFKSPLTGNLGESHCGGRSAVAIRMAGYGAIVITGRSERPVYLSVKDGKVFFRDASALWGMSRVGTVGRVIRENEGSAGLRSIMRIGRAGEEKVAFACVTTETFRHFGRLGLGAVFGSKGLKALAVAGKRDLPVSDKRVFRKRYKEIYSKAVESPLMKKYHDLGTPLNVRPLNELGAFPVKNLSETSIEGWENFSGESYAERYLGRRLACAHCPVACIHIAALREPYEDEAYFYKTSMISYDYELIYALGGMLGLTDPEGLLVLLDEVEDWGLDAMSTGVALAWATEALEKGLVSEKDTGQKLAWGDWRAYADAMARLVGQDNDFWKALARGVEHAASLFGGGDFAMAFGGNEMPGYHTGPACHIGYLAAARHSHLCNAGYSIDQKVLLKDKSEIDAEKIADRVIKEESWRQVLSSLVLCFFSRGIYKPAIVSQTLATAGFDFDETALDRLGELIYRRKYAFKFREGFSLEKIRIPRRVFETKNPVGDFDEAFIRRALAHVQAFHERDGD